MIARNHPFILAAAAAALIAAAGAQAAEQMVLASLGEVNGKVLINQGKGFVAARAGMAVKAGDRVIALEGANAAVVYADGCVTSLKEHNLLPVNASGCATAPLNPNAEVVKLAQAIGVKTDSPASDRARGPAHLPEIETPWAQVAAGGGLVLAAGLLMGGVDNTPISAK